MKLVAKNDIIIGRIVDIMQSKGGLVLPTSEIKNVTVLLLVDDVGPDVKNCKKGDVILYEAMGHAYFRDGSHWGLVHDNKVLALATELDDDVLAVEGEKRVDGKPAAPQPFTTSPEA